MTIKECLEKKLNVTNVNKAAVDDIRLINCIGFCQAMRKNYMRLALNISAFAFAIAFYIFHIIPNFEEIKTLFLIILICSLGYLILMAKSNCGNDVINASILLLNEDIDVIIEDTAQVISFEQTDENTYKIIWSYMGTNVNLDYLNIIILGEKGDSYEMIGYRNHDIVISAD